MTRYNYATIDGHKIFYREAGPTNAPVIVLLHGFPSSSHMFRDLIPKLASNFRVIAPDYLGFGFSDQPSATEYSYTFDNLTGLVEKLLFNHLNLTKFSIYMQDYGAPVGFRIASVYPEAIEAIVVQNGNAFVEGISNASEPLKAFWANRRSRPVQHLGSCRGSKERRLGHWQEGPWASRPSANPAKRAARSTALFAPATIATNQGDSK